MWDTYMYELFVTMEYSFANRNRQKKWQLLTTVIDIVVPYAPLSNTFPVNGVSQIVYMEDIIGMILKCN